MKRPIEVMLICGGDAHHDYDYVRLRLLDMLYHLGDVRTYVSADYRDVGKLEHIDALITYTCGVTPTQEQYIAIRRFLEGGGRMMALHGSNVARADSGLPELIGSRFVGHPPYGAFEVRVMPGDDPLVKGLNTFVVEDELYVIEPQPGITVLLQTRWGGKDIRGQEHPEESRPLMYRYRVGQGVVLYNALGHCDRWFEMRPATPGALPRRGAWQQPAYVELVRRGAAWACRVEAEELVRASPSER